MAIKQDISAVAATLAGIFATRSELLMLELAEEKCRFFKVLLAFVAICVFILMACAAFFVLFAILVWESPYLLCWLGGAILLFIIAAWLCYLKAKSLLLARLPFADSIAVIKEDTQQIRRSIALQREAEKSNDTI